MQQPSLVLKPWCAYRVIPNQTNKKIHAPQISLKIGTHVGSIPDQNLAYSDYSPLRYDRSIFKAIIYLSFKQP